MMVTARAGAAYLASGFLPAIFDGEPPGADRQYAKDPPAKTGGPMQGTAKLDSGAISRRASGQRQGPCRDGAQGSDPHRSLDSARPAPTSASQAWGRST